MEASARLRAAAGQAGARPLPPGALGGQARAVAALVRKAWLRTLDAPSAWLGDLFGTAVLAAVFLLVVPKTGYAPAGWSPAAWLAAGLAAVVAWNSAFSIAAYNLVLDRTEGGLEDMLVPPVSSLALVCGWLLGAASLALLTAAAAAPALFLLLAPAPADPLALFAWLALGSLAFAALGSAVGIPARRFDDVGAWEIFFVYPFLMFSAFLGAPEHLPALGRWLALLNPLSGPMNGVRSAWAGRGKRSGRPPSFIRARRRGPWLPPSLCSSPLLGPWRPVRRACARERAGCARRGGSSAPVLGSFGSD